MPIRVNYEYLLTYGAQFVGAVVGVLVVKLFAHYLTQEQFGAILSSRRIVGLAIPLLTLNLSLSFAKYNSTQSADRAGFLSIALCSLMIIWSVLVLISAFFFEGLTTFLFESTLYGKFTFTVFIYMFSASIHILFNGYWRGLRQFNIMNLQAGSFHIINLLIVLLLFFNIQGNETILNQYYLWLTLLTLILNFVLVAWKDPGILSKFSLKYFRNLKRESTLADFFSYGISRLPSGIFYAGLFMLPILAATQYISLAAAAHIGIVISVANLVFLLGFPINLIVVPKFAKHSDEESAAELRQRIQRAVNSSLSYPLLVGPLLYIFSKEIILIMFDEKYLGVSNSLQIFSLTAGLFLSYISLRGILDGIKKYPFANYVTGLGVLVTGALLLGLGLDGIEENEIVIAFCGGLASMFASNLYIIKRNFNIRFVTTQNAISATWTVLGLGVAYLIHTTIIDPQSMFLFITIKFVGASSYIAISFLLFDRLGKWTVHA